MARMLSRIIVENATFHNSNAEATIDTRLLLTRLGEFGLNPAHIVGQDEVGYRSFYTAKPVRSKLGTPGDFTFISQVSCVKPRGSNPPFVTARGFLVHWGRRGCARSL